MQLLHYFKCMLWEQKKSIFPHRQSKWKLRNIQFFPEIIYFYNIFNNVHDNRDLKLFNAFLKYKHILLLYCWKKFHL